MEGVMEAIRIEVFFAIHHLIEVLDFWEGVAMGVEIIIDRSHRRELIIAKITIALGISDDHRMLRGNPLQTDDLSGNRLFDENRIPPLTRAVLEVVGKTEDQNIVFLLRPFHISSLIGDVPT